MMCGPVASKYSPAGSVPGPGGSARGAMRTATVAGPPPGSRTLPTDVKKTGQRRATTPPPAPPRGARRTYRRHCVAAAAAEYVGDGTAPEPVRCPEEKRRGEKRPRVQPVRSAEARGERAERAEVRGGRERWRQRGVSFVPARNAQDAGRNSPSSTASGASARPKR